MKIDPRALRKAYNKDGRTAFEFSTACGFSGDWIYSVLSTGSTGKKGFEALCRELKLEPVELAHPSESQDCHRCALKVWSWQDECDNGHAKNTPLRC